MVSPFRPAAPDPQLDIDRAVLALVRGRQRMSAISRNQLKDQVPLLVDRVEKISDRQIREAIERLRQTPEGAFICSSSGAQGYWTGSPEEIEQLYAEERRRSLTLMARIRTQRDLARRQFENGRAQMELKF